MHCSCSSGSPHCVRQASAFALQLALQASDWAIRMPLAASAGIAAVIA
ncbi:MAG TPA: hypothetical protein VEK34_15525 [Methylocella sp.]|nr:hypothetical protein [Methylocella sp.]